MRIMVIFQNLIEIIRLFLDRPDFPNEQSYTTLIIVVCSLLLLVLVLGLVLGICLRKKKSARPDSIYKPVKEDMESEGQPVDD